MEPENNGCPIIGDIIAFQKKLSAKDGCFPIISHNWILDLIFYRPCLEVFVSFLFLFESVSTQNVISIRDKLLYNLISGSEGHCSRFRGFQL